jgi:hypothetical protein
MLPSDRAAVDPPAEPEPGLTLQCPWGGFTVSWRDDLPAPCHLAWIDADLYLDAAWWGHADAAARTQLLACLRGERAAPQDDGGDPWRLQAWGPPEGLADMEQRIAAVPAAFWELLVLIP